MFDAGYQLAQEFNTTMYIKKIFEKDAVWWFEIRLPRLTNQNF